MGLSGGARKEVAFYGIRGAALRNAPLSGALPASPSRAASLLQDDYACSVNRMPGISHSLAAACF